MTQPHTGSSGPIFAHPHDGAPGSSFTHPHIETSGSIFAQFVNWVNGTDLSPIRTLGHGDRPLLKLHFGVSGAKIAQPHGGSLGPILTQAVIASPGRTMHRGRIEDALQGNFDRRRRVLMPHAHRTQKCPGAQARAKR
jgi:hypothetical protein